MLSFNVLSNVRAFVALKLSETNFLTVSPLHIHIRLRIRSIARARFVIINFSSNYLIPQGFFSFRVSTEDMKSLYFIVKASTLFFSSTFLRINKVRRLFFHLSQPRGNDVRSCRFLFLSSLQTVLPPETG